MKIPIKSLKEFARDHSLSHVIVFARDRDGKNHHVATYGVTIEQCSHAADTGNRLKTILDWPKSLQLQPSRVKKLQQKLNVALEELVEARKKYTLLRMELSCPKCSEQFKQGICQSCYEKQAAKIQELENETS